MYLWWEGRQTIFSPALYKNTKARQNYFKLSVIKSTHFSFVSKQKVYLTKLSSFLGGNKFTLFSIISLVLISLSFMEQCNFLQPYTYYNIKYQIIFITFLNQDSHNNKDKNYHQDNFNV